MTYLDISPVIVHHLISLLQLLKLGGDLESDYDGSCVRLKIREVYPEDEGEYSCIIISEQGKAVTSATLIVESE